MGYKTIQFDEFDTRVTEYWHPSDFDQASVSGEVAGIQAGWNGEGFIKLVFDDATFVLTGVMHRIANGEQWVWETSERPEDVIAAAQAAERAASAPQSFADMWQTYNGWDDYLVYAAERYMQENTDFLVAVEAYRQSPSLPAQMELYGRFVVDGAPEQVNIDATTVAAIEERADGAADVFDAAQQEIMDLLSAEFPTGFRPWYLARPAS